MRVTVCQWPNSRDALVRAWTALVDHVRDQSSELVLLPEMAFLPWIAASRTFNPALWGGADPLGGLSFRSADWPTRVGTPQ